MGFSWTLAVVVALMHHLVAELGHSLDSGMSNRCGCSACLCYPTFKSYEMDPADLLQACLKKYTKKACND